MRKIKFPDVDMTIQFSESPCVIIGELWFIEGPIGISWTFSMAHTMHWFDIIRIWTVKFNGNLYRTTCSQLIFNWMEIILFLAAIEWKYIFLLVWREITIRKLLNRNRCVSFHFPCSSLDTNLSKYTKPQRTNEKSILDYAWNRIDFKPFKSA